jgi:hypothetical protein
VDACNPLLQAHPTRARDKHEGRGIPTSLSLAPAAFFPPSRSVSRRPIWAGARGDIFTRRPRDPPISKRRHYDFIAIFFSYYIYNCVINIEKHKNLAPHIRFMYSYMNMQ